MDSANIGAGANATAPNQMAFGTASTLSEPELGEPAAFSLILSGGHSRSGRGPDRGKTISGPARSSEGCPAGCGRLALTSAVSTDPRIGMATSLSANLEMQVRLFPPPVHIG